MEDITIPVPVIGAWHSLTSEEKNAVKQIEKLLDGFTVMSVARILLTVRQDCAKARFTKDLSCYVYNQT